MYCLLMALATVIGVVLFKKFCHKGEIISIEEQFIDCVPVDQFLENLCAYKNIDIIQGLVCVKKLRENFSSILVDINNQKPSYVFSHKGVVIIHLSMIIQAIDHGVILSPSLAEASLNDESVML